MSLAGKFRRVINLVRYYSNVTDRYFDWFYNRRFRPGFSLADKKRVIDRQFRETAGYDMDWDNPRTFNQKLQWLKLFNEDPLITKCAGKDTAKVYVAERLGAEYVVPNIGVYDSVDDIPFESLPDAFVLKVNWGSGQNIIVRDKCAADISGIKRKLSTWMRPESNHYWFSFEFSYRDVVPKIVCEPYLGELDANLTVYKVFNFKGEPYLIQTIGDGSIIGACSVVTKNVPPGEIWAGNPARRISTVDEYAKKVRVLSTSSEQLALSREVLAQRGYVWER